MFKYFFKKNVKFLEIFRSKNNQKAKTYDRVRKEAHHEKY